MALLFMDGFRGGDATSKWNTNSVAYTATSDANSRTTGGYYASTGFGGNLYKSVTASNKLIVGFGACWTFSEVPTITFYGDSGATAHITVQADAVNAALRIKRGTTGGTVLATGTTPVSGSGAGWHYIEVSVTISDTVGEVHVRVDGNTVDEVSYTGDTKNGGTNTTIDMIWVQSSRVRIADLYVLNDTGSAPLNDFLGDVVVRSLYPNGNGTYSQLTNSASNSVNNYTYVDETPFSSTDYVGSATTGQKDSYAMSDLPAGVSTVYGVQINGSMAKSDATLAQSSLLLRTNGSDYNGTTRVLSTGYVTYYDTYGTNPVTGLAWTVGDVNNVETGMQVQ